MRRHPIGAATRHEARRVVVLVGPNRNGDADNLRCVREHLSCRVAFDRTARLRHLRVHRRAMPVIREQVSDIAKQHTSAPALVKQLRLAVCCRFVRLVAALLTVPVLALTRTAVGRRIAIRLVPAYEALVPDRRLNQSAVHAEMLAGQITLRIRRFNRLVEQLHDDVVLEQPVTVLAEGRVVPHHIVDRKPDEPAEQHVAGDLLRQHPFASNRVQQAQQQCTNQPLRRDTRAADLSSLSYMCANTGSMRLSVPFSEIRIGRKRWLAGTKSSSFAIVKIATV
jgi:hypothetical protein